jgi:hypothetical protein
VTSNQVDDSSRKDSILFKQWYLFVGLYYNSECSLNFRHNWQHSLFHGTKLGNKWYFLLAFVFCVFHCQQQQKQRFKLPAKAVSFVLTKDLGASKVDIVIDRVIVPNVLVDGGLNDNIMLEETAFELGYMEFKPTPTILRMANQAWVQPVGQLSRIATMIAGQTFALHYVIIRVDIGSPSPVLLRQPWLYTVDVQVD